MRACTAGHCTVRGLWCCVQMPSLRSPVHSVQPPVSDRETVKRPTLRIGWERPCSWSLRLSQIYASVEISRGGEDGWRAPRAFGSWPNALGNGRSRSGEVRADLLNLIPSGETLRTRGRLSPEPFIRELGDEILFRPQLVGCTTAQKFFLLDSSQAKWRCGFSCEKMKSCSYGGGYGGHGTN